MFTLPMLVVLQFKEVPLGWADYVLAFLVLGFIVLETIADQQQWDYQSEKYRLKAMNMELKGVYEKGFVDTGLWAHSRHPNYLAEQLIWITFYGFSVVASGQWINWSIIGCLLLVLLFQESSRFSEEISASKYPEYKIYQARVPRFIGWKKA